ncbi:MAG TPA: S-layer homology domain-containing protein [Thermoanaerobaculia bacterium]|nr:S-layer homology domain-containing protein [Thermoanaerobaculia bacterium]
MSRRILAVLGSLACAGAAARAQGWGTAPGATTLMAHDLSAEYGVSSEPGTTAPIVQYLGATWCAEPYGTPDLAYRANGQVQVPDGATLSQLQIWAYDIDAVDGLTVELWETCQPPGLNPPASTLLGSVDSVGAIGTYFGFTPLNGHRVDNANCAYTARVNFNPGSVCKGSAIQLQKVQVAWTRDVAPAPAAATFGDVSTSHPFFQYVEALVTSGVTGGCGGGNYCPDAPLTRGQMAVFLSKALGLEWP